MNNLSVFALFPKFCRALFAVSLFLVSGSVQATEHQSPPSDSVEVNVRALLIDLTKIDGPEQMFNADVVLAARWQDDRLKDPNAEGMRLFALNEVWTPNLTVANLRDVKKFLPERVTVSPEGEVTYRQRLMGDFTSRLDLHRFPNDSQMLTVHVVARGYSPDQVKFVFDRSAGRAKKLTIADWSVGDVLVKCEPYEVSGLPKLAGMRLEIPVIRHVRYYFATIFASAAIIVCMAWMVFWMPVEATNPRISISVTSMLTLIAHRFVVGNELPRLSYLTQMDYFLLGATFMVLMGLMGVVTVARVSSQGNAQLGVKLNGVFRWLYPIIFCSMLVVFL